MSVERQAGYFLPPAWLCEVEQWSADHLAAERAMTAELIARWGAVGIDLRAHLTAERDRA